MYPTSALLNIKSHRPFALPQRSWKYHQEWNDTLFLHFKADAGVLQELLPEGLELDIINGEAWVSIVAFTVNNMRLKYLPPMPYASDFNEVNLRTYVIRDGVPGIYFISIETDKILTVLAANIFVGLNYQKAKLKRRTNNYILKKSKAKNYLDVKYLCLGSLQEKAVQDKWLTERYCAYETINGKMYRFNIHHKPWPLKKIKLRQLKMHFQYKGLLLHTQKPYLLHYAPAQKVLLWGRERC